MRLFFSLVISFVTFRGCLADGFEFTLGHIRPSSSIETQEEAVINLIERLIHEKGKYFDIQIDPNLVTDGKDTFKVFKEDQGINVSITASSGVAAAWGFHYYLKHYCNCHVSWDADQLNLGDHLPEVNISIIANDRFRYYQNVCTSSYSFVWWSADRWRREIDWMAMNGINFALAFNGQEEIWRRVYLQLGMTDAEINEHLTGPAFNAWGRMGNIRGWGGPLSTAWLNQSVQLQTKILKQMRDIGIIPILPAFAGQVPRAFKRIYPDASLQPFQPWNRFPDQYCCPYLLSPEDPLFRRVGNLFLKEYRSQFGTDHVYNCDTFNEMTPPSGDSAYLHSVGSAIYKAMTLADPKAIWVLQGWFLHSDKEFWTKKRAEAFLTSIEIGKMIVLDLQAELTPQYEVFDSFFGQPFIWCMLHNFGGTLGMHGAATKVNEGPFKARSEQNSSMVGTGLTPEGINQNYVIYDLMNEMGFEKQQVNLTRWFEEYSKSRYGVDNNNAKRMWVLLKDSVYNYNGVIAQHGKYIFVHTPSLVLQPQMWYNVCVVAEAWDELIKAIDTWQPPGSSIPDTFLYDSVDLSRQALQLLLDESYVRVIKQVQLKNVDLFTKESEIFISLLRSMVELLSSHENFLLQPWIDSAKSLATSDEDRKLYEMNARNQITLWGPNGEIKDYANKQWAGLISEYYLPRWELFFDYVKKALAEHNHIDQKKIQEIMFSEVEKPFSESTNKIHESYTGNTIETVKKIYTALRHRFQCSSVIENIGYVNTG